MNVSTSAPYVRRASSAYRTPDASARLASIRVPRSGSLSLTLRPYGAFRSGPPRVDQRQSRLAVRRPRALVGEHALDRDVPEPGGNARRRDGGGARRGVHEMRRRSVSRFSRFRLNVGAFRFLLPRRRKRFLLPRRQKRLGGAREVEQRRGGFVVRVPALSLARLRPRGARGVHLVVRGVDDHRVAAPEPRRELGKLARARGVRDVYDVPSPHLDAAAQAVERGVARAPRRQRGLSFDRKHASVSSVASVASVRVPVVHVVVVSGVSGVSGVARRVGTIERDGEANHAAARAEIGDARREPRFALRRRFPETRDPAAQRLRGVRGEQQRVHVAPVPSARLQQQQPTPEQDVQGLVRERVHARAVETMTRRGVPELDFVFRGGVGAESVVRLAVQAAFERARLRADEPSQRRGHVLFGSDAQELFRSLAHERANSLRRGRRALRQSLARCRRGWARARGGRERRTHDPGGGRAHAADGRGDPSPPPTRGVDWTK